MMDRFLVFNTRHHLYMMILLLFMSYDNCFFFFSFSFLMLNRVTNGNLPNNLELIKKKKIPFKDLGKGTKNLIYILIERNPFDLSL